MAVENASADLGGMLGPSPGRIAALSRKSAFRWAWQGMFTLAGLLFLSSQFRAEAPRVRAGVNDFMGIYAGARLAGSPEQFDAQAYIREQISATGWSAPSILYTRLPAFAMVLRPLGAMEYRNAYAVWQAVSLACVALFVMLWEGTGRMAQLWALSWSFPLFAAIAGGQDLPLLLLILAVAWRLAPSRPGLAGVILSLLSLKFHLFLLVPLALAAQRQWRTLAAAGLACSGILAACFAAAGPAWLPAYVRFVLQKQTNPDVRRMPNLHGLFEGLQHSLAWELAGAALVAAAVWWIARRTSFSVALSAALAGSLLISHHAYPADAVMLLPALLTLIIAVPRPSVRVLSVLLLCPAPFLVSATAPLANPAAILLLALLVSLAFYSRTAESSPTYSSHRSVKTVA